MEQKSLKNVIITTSLGSGGAERMLHRLLSNWKIKERILVINLTEPGQFSEKIRALGIEVHDLNLFQAPWNLIKLITLLFSTNICALWGWMYHGNICAFVARLFFAPRAKLIWNIRHTLYDIEREKPLTKFVVKVNAVLSFSIDKIIFNSKLSQDQHMAFGFSADKCTYIPNGFDIENFEGKQQESEQITVGHVGRFHPMKNQKRMIEAFVQAAKINPRLRFELVGKGMVPDNQEIQKLIPRDIASRFSFHGELMDVYKNYANMDIFVLFSSWGEAFPNVLVEATLSGGIPVSSDVGDAQDIVRDDDYIVPINDQSGLVEKILKFASLGREERKKRNSTLKQSMIERFSIQNVAREFHQYLGKT